MASATKTTLAVTELLELILVKLPPLKIISVQRVCKAWRDCIEHSPILQEATFCRPATKIEICSPPGTVITTHHFHPALVPLMSGRKLRLELTEQKGVFTTTVDDRFFFGALYYFTGNKRTKHIWGSQYLTQPPISRLQMLVLQSFYMEEFGKSIKNNELLHMRSNSEGLRLKDLYSAIKQKIFDVTILGEKPPCFA
jgi:hypothetical protein